MNSTMWKSTESWKHVVGEVKEKGTITFTYVCEQQEVLSRKLLVCGGSLPTTAQHNEWLVVQVV